MNYDLRFVVENRMKKISNPKSQIPKFHRASIRTRVAAALQNAVRFTAGDLSVAKRRARITTYGNNGMPHLRERRQRLER
jgi:hypothetical protein